MARNQPEEVLMAEEYEYERVLPIKTVYYADKRAKEIVRVNHAGTAFRAVPLVIEHMQANDYSAVLAECFDLNSGELHAVIRRSVDGEINIIFKREPERGH